MQFPCIASLVLLEVRWWRSSCSLVAKRLSHMFVYFRDGSGDVDFVLVSRGCCY